MVMAETERKSRIESSPPSPLLLSSSTITTSSSSSKESDVSHRLQWLRQRRETLEEKISQKNNELKNLCINEAELTGILPPEIPLDPGESPPYFRKRVGTLFTYPQNLINKLKTHDNIDESTLELERQVQISIAKAAYDIINDTTKGKAVRRKNRLVYQQSQKKLKEIETRLNFIRQGCGQLLRRPISLEATITTGTINYPTWPSSTSLPGDTAINDDDDSTPITQTIAKHKSKKPRPPGFGHSASDKFLNEPMNYEKISKVKSNNSTDSDNQLTKIDHYHHYHHHYHHNKYDDENDSKTNKWTKISKNELPTTVTSTTQNRKCLRSNSDIIHTINDNNSDIYILPNQHLISSSSASTSYSHPELDTNKDMHRQSNNSMWLRDKKNRELHHYNQLLQEQQLIKQPPKHYQKYQQHYYLHNDDSNIILPSSAIKYEDTISLQQLQQQLSLSPQNESAKLFELNDAYHNQQLFTSPLSPYNYPLSATTVFVDHQYSNFLSPKDSKKDMIDKTMQKRCDSMKEKVLFKKKNSHENISNSINNNNNNNNSNSNNSHNNMDSHSLSRRDRQAFVHSDNCWSTPTVTPSTITALNDDNCGDKFGSIDRRKYCNNSNYHSPTINHQNNQNYHPINTAIPNKSNNSFDTNLVVDASPKYYGNSKPTQNTSRDRMTDLLPSLLISAPSTRNLLRTQSLGSVETWHSGDNNSSNNNYTSSSSTTNTKNILTSPHTGGKTSTLPSATPPPMVYRNKHTVDGFTRTTHDYYHARDSEKEWFETSIDMDYPNTSNNSNNNNHHHHSNSSSSGNNSCNSKATYNNSINALSHTMKNMEISSVIESNNKNNNNSRSNSSTNDINSNINNSNNNNNCQNILNKKVTNFELLNFNNTLDSNIISDDGHTIMIHAGKYKPYKEITKPFEMSDFYKYSTKFRKKMEAANSNSNINSINSSNNNNTSELEVNTSIELGATGAGYPTMPCNTPINNKSSDYDHNTYITSSSQYNVIPSTSRIVESERVPCQSYMHYLKE